MFVPSVRQCRSVPSWFEAHIPEFSINKTLRAIAYGDEWTTCSSPSGIGSSRDYPLKARRLTVHNGRARYHRNLFILGVAPLPAMIFFSGVYEGLVMYNPTSPSYE
jgi:hypothetical protein